MKREDIRLTSDRVITPQELLDPKNYKTVFDKKSLNEIYDEIRSVYLNDDRPWVIGYSGGKDSTTVVQLVWYALKDLEIEKLKKPVYIISSDTLVETPAIVNHIDISLNKMRKAAKEQGLPFYTEKVIPDISQTFWVNLIGRGYPAPSREFRWCTDRLKIKPTNKFILEKVKQSGEVILVLGVRKEESMTRAQVMEYQKSRKPGDLFSAHSTIPGALVYTPIEDFTTNDVWNYLLQKESPWGGNNRNLSALYQSASGECPLVVDKTTPSCGNSRFGCWTCTVVQRDVSLESMIEQGEQWLEPLREFRNFLKETQKPSNKAKFRSHRRRDGRITRKTLKQKDGGGNRILIESALVFGPYLMSFRQELLRRLLVTENEIQASISDPEFTLIKIEELQEIRRIWVHEELDWNDSLPKIYEEVKGIPFPRIDDDVGQHTIQDMQLLEKICKKKGVPVELAMRLLDLEMQTFDLITRPNIHQKIEKILKRDYTGRNEAILEITGMSEEDYLSSLEEEELLGEGD